MRRDEPAQWAPLQHIDTASLEACDESAVDAPRREDCPTVLLERFGDRMAEHGRTILPAVMLADREYAMWQLARARMTEDAELRQLAAELFSRLAH